MLKTNIVYFRVLVGAVVDDDFEVEMLFKEDQANLFGLDRKNPLNKHHWILQISLDLLQIITLDMELTDLLQIALAAIRLLNETRKCLVHIPQTMHSHLGPKPVKVAKYLLAQV